MPNSDQTIHESRVDDLLRSMEGDKPASHPPVNDVREFLAKADHFWVAAQETKSKGQFSNKLGRFQLIKLLGEGGFGLVYLAKDTVTEKTVALKLPRPERIVRTDWRERFLREARTAAILHHPNIVRIYDAGEIEGQWYISTSYCPGPNLAQWLSTATAPVGIMEAAQLLATLADAMSHAHDRGVIHRDLKPGNILLQPRISDPPSSLENFTPWITDFGLAKLIEESGVQTRSDILMGTVQYMAPEQAEMRQAEVGPATDIYALGLLCYELLTGRPVIPAEPMVLTLPKILHELAPRLRSVRPDCPVDLETIYLHCLEKAPGKRYSSARALHEDLVRFLKGKSIHARPAGIMRRAGNWVRREPLFATVLVSMLLVTMVILGSVLWHGKQTEIANRTFRELLHRTQQLHYLSTIQRAAQLVQSGDAAEASQLLHGIKLEMFDWSMPLTSEWKYLWNTVQQMPRHFRWHGHQVTPYALAFSPARNWVATCDSLGVLMIRNAETGTVIKSLQCSKRACPTLAFSIDGRWLAQLCGDANPNIDTALVWDTNDWSVRNSLILDDEIISSLCFHPREPALVLTTKHDVVINEKGRVITWNYFDVQAKPKTVLSDARCHKIWWTPVRQSFVLATVEDFKLLDEQFHARRLSPGPHDEIQAAATSLDGNWFAWGNREGAINLFDFRRSTSVAHHSWRAHPEWIYDLDFSPSSRLLASCGQGHLVQLWDVETGKLAHQLRARGNTNGVIFAADGNSVFFTSSEDYAVHRWYFADNGPTKRQANLTDQVWCAKLTDDEKGMYLGLDDDQSPFTIRQLDLTKSPFQIVRKSELQKATVTGIVPLNKAGRMISASLDGTLALHELRTGKVIQTATMHQERGIRQLIELSAGKTVATCGHDGLIQIWNIQLKPDGEPLQGHGKDAVRDLCYDTRQNQLYSSGDDRRIVQWDLSTRQPVRSLEAVTEVRSLCLSHDGRYLAYGTKLGEIVLVSLDDWKVVRRFEPHDDPVTEITFTPDGRSLIAGDFTGHLYLWHLESGQELLQLPAHENRIAALLWNKDGTRLYSAGLDGRVVEHDFR